jgi:hypothetical protein
LELKPKKSPCLGTPSQPKREFIEWRRGSILTDGPPSSITESMSQLISKIIAASLTGITDARGGVRWALLRELAFHPDRLRVLLWQICLYLVFFVFPFLRPGFGLATPTQLAFLSDRPGAARASINAQVRAALAPSLLGLRSPLPIGSRRGHVAAPAMA